MGRPTRSGGGGGSRSRSSGSGGSRSRSSSSRPSRSYSSSSSRSYGSSRSYRSSGGVNINIGGSGYGYGSRGYSGGSSLPAPVNAALAIAVVLIVIAYLFIPATRPNFSSGPRSTIAREKIVSGYGFDHNCITDEIGYFDSISTTGKQLKYFHDKTGIQPFVYLKEYDSSLVSLTQKEEYAKQLYNTLFPNRNDVFLYVYFEPSNPNDIGDEAYWIGMQANGVMDSEAQDIFFNKLSTYWDNVSLSTDDVYIKTFTATADAIMKVDRGNTVFYITAVICLAVSIVAVASFYKLKEKNKRAKEEAEETERILKTDIGGLVKMTGEDDLVDKYK